MIDARKLNFGITIQYSPSYFLNNVVLSVWYACLQVVYYHYH